VTCGVGGDDPIPFAALAGAHHVGALVPASEVPFVCGVIAMASLPDLGFLPYEIRVAATPSGRDMSRFFSYRTTSAVWPPEEAAAEAADPLY
jgi:hypothetical protein